MTHNESIQIAYKVEAEIFATYWADLMHSDSVTLPRGGDWVGIIARAIRNEVNLVLSEFIAIASDEMLRQYAEKSGMTLKEIVISEPPPMDIHWPDALEAVNA